MKGAGSSFSAVLLAAGRSRRAGLDKALRPAADGRAMWERQSSVLAAAGATEMFISARPEQKWVPAGAAVVLDARADAGPLGGIVAALERATHGHLMVSAVDLPAMRTEWFSKLWASCAPGVGAVGRHSGATGYFEPLAAIYPREILPAARAALARGEGSLQRLIAAEAARFAVREIGAEAAAWFENRNEPA